MKAAFSYLDNRIAPVFDTARQIVLVEAVSRRIVKESQEIFGDDLPVQKAIQLAEFSVNALVCGAISKQLQEIIIAYGTQVVPFVIGDLKEVIYAWANNRLYDRRFTMPGCRGLRSQRFGCKVFKEQEDTIMPRGDGTGPQGTGKRGGGMGAGGGRGQGQSQGQGGQGAGRMGRAAAGAVGFCVCPQCGDRQPHQRGTPCFEQKCSKCGASMARE